jgi:hypothetical protein
MTDDAQDVLNSYLREVDMFAEGLPADERAELIAGLTEHVKAAQAAGQASDVVQARALIARLGEPSSIVRQAAAASDDAAFVRVFRQVRGTARETVAVLLIIMGSFVPIIGWLAGIALAWGSNRLRTGEKLLLTLVVPLGPFGAVAFIFGYLAGETSIICSEGAYGTTDGPYGPVTSVVRIPRSCTHPAMPPTLGLFIALVIAAASVIVPIVVWLRVYKRTTTRRRSASWSVGVPPVPAH